MPLPQTTHAQTNTNFFSTGDDIFAAGMYNAGTSISGDPMSNGFLMGNDWDMTAMGAGTTGMTPMSEGSWNQVLETMNLGWDSLGPPHPHTGNNG